MDQSGLNREFFRAAKNGNFDRVIELIHHAQVDVNTGDYRYRTALYFAAQENHLDVFNLLIERGANPKAADWNGLTILHEAAGNGNLTMVETLVRLGAEVNAINRSYFPPLHFTNNPEVIDFLIQNKAEVNAVDDDGSTALHYAAQSNYDQCIMALIKGGADRTIQDMKDKTAAEITESAEIKTLIEEYRTVWTPQIHHWITNETQQLAILTLYLIRNTDSYLSLIPNELMFMLFQLLV